MMPQLLVISEVSCRADHEQNDVFQSSEHDYNDLGQRWSTLLNQLLWYYCSCI